ncbi:cupin domain-containing protein [Pikeienuella sp. HZG-20]|uniref:cupin domain-containing protein n=1 Tax=Paludibacillus litoralis TaxID=3133267 RepID=UPI0030ECB25C
MSKERESATPETLVDNDRVRVTKWSFKPGEATGWHVHEYDYVVTPIVGSMVVMIDGDGKEANVEMVVGTSYFRQAGVAHDVVNAGAGPLVFVETELKEARP